MRSFSGSRTATRRTTMRAPEARLNLPGVAAEDGEHPSPHDAESCDADADLSHLAALTMRCEASSALTWGTFAPPPWAKVSMRTGPTPGA